MTVGSETTMRAWVVDRQAPVETSPLRSGQKPVPAPAPGELLVRVLACAVCRTDLHVIEGDLPVHREHVPPGHMVVGTVGALGEGAEGSAEGDRVGVAWLRHTDGTCRYCRRGNENLCPDSRYTGWDADGGYADYTTVPAAFAYRLPSDVDDVELAPLLCAGIIGYRALLRASVPERGRLGLYGVGDSAHPTAQVAPAAGARARRRVGRRRLRPPARAAGQRDLVRAGRGSGPGRDAGARPRRRPRRGRDPPDRHPAAELRAGAVLREGTAQRHVQHPAGRAGVPRARRPGPRPGHDSHLPNGAGAAGTAGPQGRGLRRGGRSRQRLGAGRYADSARFHRRLSNATAAAAPRNGSGGILIQTPFRQLSIHADPIRSRVTQGGRCLR